MQLAHLERPHTFNCEDNEGGNKYERITSKLLQDTFVPGVIDMKVAHLQVRLSAGDDSGADER